MSRRLIVTSVTALGVLASSLAGAASATAATAPSLTIRTDHSSYVAGAKAKVTVHLSVPGGKQYINLFRTIAGKPADYVGTFQGDTKGYVVQSVPVAYNESFTASYGGSADGKSYYPATVTSRSVKVRVAMATKLTGYYTTRSGYRLVHRAKRGTFAAAVGPNKAREHLRFVLQAYVKGAWHTKLTHTEAMTKANSSASGAAVDFRYSPRVHLRIRAEYRGDRLNAARNSGWSYVEFV